MSKNKVTAVPPVSWHISTHSADGGRQCVEAGPFTNGTSTFAMRDSTHREHGHLTFSSPEWAALLTTLD